MHIPEGMDVRGYDKKCEETNVPQCLLCLCQTRACGSLVPLLLQSVTWGGAQKSKCPVCQQGKEGFMLTCRLRVQTVREQGNGDRSQQLPTAAHTVSVAQHQNDGLIIICSGLIISVCSSFYSVQEPSSWHYPPSRSISPAPLKLSGNILTETHRDVFPWKSWISSSCHEDQLSYHENNAC